MKILYHIGGSSHSWQLSCVILHILIYVSSMNVAIQRNAGAVTKDNSPSIS